MNGHPGGPKLYPWLAEPWRTLDAHFLAGRVPQGLLIQGPAGVGKLALAETFARKLLCLRPGVHACGACSGCHLFDAGTHPDFIRVVPPEPGKGIGVDAIRHLCGHLALTSHYGGFRVVVIAPAHLMNLNASNALLKTLEEPADRTVILLLTESHAQLPATIISRCQRLPVPMPSHAAAIRWLEAERPGQAAEVLLAAAGGSPLKALALAESGLVERRHQALNEALRVADGRAEPVAVAERWGRKDQDQEEILGWLLSVTADLIRLAWVADCRQIGNPDFRDDLQRLAGRLHLTGLCEHWNLLLQTRRSLATQANRQLLLEEVLIRWSELGQFPHPMGHEHERHR